jgi:HK97 family phage major capsid protein
MTKHTRAHLLSTAAGGLGLELKDEAPSLASINSLVEKLMANQEEMKSANDLKFSEIEKKGSADPLLADKLEKLDTEFKKVHGDLQTKMQEMEKKANRPQLGDDTAKDAALELKHFNIAIKHHYQVIGRSMPAADYNAEDYGLYKKAMTTYLLYGKDSMSDVEKKAAQIGSDPSGGYLVTPEIDNQITRVVTQVGAMRSLATVRSIGSSSLKKIAQTSGAAFGGWGNEKTAATETGTPDLAELEFVPGTCWAAPRATTELLEDASIDIANWLVGEVDLVFDEQEGSAFATGDGKNKPKGVLGYDKIVNSSYSWGSIGYVRSGAAADFAAANPSDRLMDLMHAVKRQYRSGASFVMTDKSLAAIRKFKDGQGNYLWVPGLQGGVVGVLLGKPVVTDDFWDELGADKFPLGYGDWKRGYVIVDRRGTTVLRDPYTAQPYVKFIVTRRVGGGMQNFEAVKLMKCEVGTATD